MLPPRCCLNLQLCNLIALLMRFDDAAPKCGGTCAANWKRCGGNSLEISPCCNTDFHCVKRDSLYSQCRDKKKPVPSGWEGSTADCNGGTAPPPGPPSGPPPRRMAKSGAMEFLDSPSPQVPAAGSWNYELDTVRLTSRSLPSPTGG
jgi:hypothetical protein